MSLAKQQCVPCQVGAPPLKGERITKLLDEIDDAWTVCVDHHLERTIAFKDFAEALAYVARVGEMAEEQAHHPDIYLAWGQVRIEVWTHKIDGLTESDFVFAAKADQLLQA